MHRQWETVALQCDPYPTSATCAERRLLDLEELQQRNWERLQDTTLRLRNALSAKRKASRVATPELGGSPQLGVNAESGHRQKRQFVRPKSAPSAGAASAAARRRRRGHARVFHQDLGKSLPGQQLDL
mmetsp:Transcript_16827/g.39473  ORF Transcript_16827/g.39473 Transcript_16827/m.39473 type:complete len:128 (+) Transcript_16827:65-448(+)